MKTKYLYITSNSKLQTGVNVKDFNVSPKVILIDLMVSSFGHTVRLLRLLQYFRDNDVKNTIIVPLPKNTSNTLKEYITSRTQKLGNCLIVFHDIEQIDLNRAQNLIKEAGSKKHQKWIETQRNNYDMFSPVMTIMSSALLGCYFADKTSVNIGISEPAHVFPGCLDLIGISPKITRKLKVLRPIFSQMMNMLLAKPLCKNLNHNARLAGMSERYTADTFLGQHALFNHIIFPTTPLWDPLYDEEMVRSRIDYDYMGELFTNSDLRTYHTMEDQILKYKNNSKLVLLFLGGSIIREDEKYVEKFVKDVVLGVLKLNEDLKVLVVSPHCNIKKLDLRECDSNRVMVLDGFFPLQILLKYVEVIILFGGHGSLMECIRYKVSVISLAINADQKIQSEKAEINGIGYFPQRILPWKIEKRGDYFESLPRSVKKIVRFCSVLLQKENKIETLDIYKELKRFEKMQPEIARKLILKYKYLFLRNKE